MKEKKKLALFTLLTRTSCVTITYPGHVVSFHHQNLGDGERKGTLVYLLQQIDKVGSALELYLYFRKIIGSNSRLKGYISVCHVIEPCGRVLYWGFENIITHICLKRSCRRWNAGLVKVDKTFVGSRRSCITDIDLKN
jgi:hypothetical protein